MSQENPLAGVRQRTTFANKPPILPSPPRLLADSKVQNTQYDPGLPADKVVTPDNGQSGQLGKEKSGQITNKSTK